MIERLVETTDCSRLGSSSIVHGNLELHNGKLVSVTILNTLNKVVVKIVSDGTYSGLRLLVPEQLAGGNGDEGASD